LYPERGQPSLSPWQLALVRVLQFRENLPDRQAAEAVRARIDWKFFLGLELTDPGFDFSVLSEFPGAPWARLRLGGAEARLQHIAIAAAINLDCIVASLEEIPRALTRTSRFAALKPV